MMHGVAATSGHLADNGGIRGHSAGPVFPFVLYVQGTFDELGYWVRQPNGLCIGPFKEWELAESFAMRLKMFGQLNPEKSEAVDITRRVTEPAYTYYRTVSDGLSSEWRWRISVGADARNHAEVSCDYGQSWSSSAYRMHHICQSPTFVSLGSEPLWQEQ